MYVFENNSDIRENGNDSFCIGAQAYVTAYGSYISVATKCSQFLKVEILRK